MFHNPLTREPSPPFLQVTASLENVGHSAAQHIEVIPELFFEKFDSNTWHDTVASEEKKWCSRIAEHPPINNAGVIIFPSEKWDWNGGTGAIRVPQDSAAALILCVDYQDASGNHFQTQAISDLYENRNAVIQTGVDADASHLRMIRDQSGDHAN